jgi:isoleucyl-tRNA synthetase
VVAMDRRLDAGLIREGLAREFTSRVQALRRQMDYAVTDRVRIGYEASSDLGEAIETHRQQVADETLAVLLREGLLEPADRCEEWDVEGERVRISILRA